jgi:hypothetical protein
MAFLTWLSQSAPAVWARESESVWGYPTILFLHTFGLALLVGFSTAIDFRILGFTNKLPLAPLDRFFRMIWLGFWINAISGAALLIMSPAKLGNPAFGIKMVLIALGVLDTLWMKRSAFRQVESGAVMASPLGKALAAGSLVMWAGAITAGRLMAYLGR